MAEGREDKRVALLAVAITGVVGITAPVVACATAKQSDDAAARIQDTTLRQERIAGDLRELRAVLDAASVNLQQHQTHLRRLEHYWESRSKPVSASDRALLNRSNRVALNALQRLRIRLPPGSDVVEAYHDAGSHAEAVAYVMFNLVPRGNVSKVRRQLMQASRDYDRFIAAANRLVGSHLR